MPRPAGEGRGLGHRSPPPLARRRKDLRGRAALSPLRSSVGPRETKHCASVPLDVTQLYPSTDSVRSGRWSSRDCGSRRTGFTYIGLREFCAQLLENSWARPISVVGRAASITKYSPMGWGFYLNDLQGTLRKSCRPQGALNPLTSTPASYSDHAAGTDGRENLEVVTTFRT